MVVFDEGTPAKGKSSCSLLELGGSKATVQSNMVLVAQESDSILSTGVKVVMVLVNLIGSTAGFAGLGGYLATTNKGV